MPTVGAVSNNGELNRAISNALAEAFGTLFDDKGLLGTWSGKVTAAVTEPTRREASVSPDELLAQLTALRKKGADVDAMSKAIRDMNLNAELSVLQIARWKNDGTPERMIRKMLDLPVAPE